MNKSWLSIVASILIAASMLSAPTTRATANEAEQSTQESSEPPAVIPDPDAEPSCDLQLSECEFILGQAVEVINLYEGVIQEQDKTMTEQMAEIDRLNTELNKETPWYLNRTVLFLFGAGVGAWAVGR
jgi:hypothetical protein